MIDFDPGPLMRGLFWTVMIPVALGLIVGERRRAFIDSHGPQIGLLVKPFMLSMLAINAALLVPYLQGIPAVELVRLYLVVFMQMMGGYLLGFAITVFFGLDYAASITMTYAATMRNNGAGILIAVSYFSPLMALPITLNTLIQQPIASTIYKFYRPWRVRRDGLARDSGARHGISCGAKSRFVRKGSAGPRAKGQVDVLRKREFVTLNQPLGGVGDEFAQAYDGCFCLLPRESSCP